MTFLARRHLVRAVSLGVAMGAASPALADEVLDITITVANSCAVTGDPIPFDTYYSGQSQALTAQGALQYTGCPVGTKIVLGDGQYGANNARNFNANGQLLPYQLYQDAAYSQAWTSAGYELPQDALLVGSIPVYARVVGGLTPPAGNYTDSVQINVTF